MQLDRTAWEALYGTSGSVFPDNTTEEISEGDMRTFGKNLSDSFFNKTNDAYTGAKGQRAGLTAPASLKDIVTTTLSLGTLITFTDSTASNVVRIYELTNETTAESSPTIIRPNDYAATTNERVWRLRSTTDVDSDTGGGGGGSGTVESVNGDAGPDVVLDAGDIPFTPTGTIAATDTQGAIEELDTEMDARISTAVSGAIAGLQWKNPARVATTANGTLATAYENGDTVDGVVIATGDRILLKNQTTQTENGIYTVNASGAPTRATDADTGAELEGATLTILEGTTNANTTWVQTTDSVTVGSSNLIFTQFGSTVVDADSTTKGIAKLYSSTSLGTNTDGAPSQNAVKVYTDTADALRVDKETFATLTFASPTNWDQNNRQMPLAKVVATGNFTINMTNVNSGAQGVLQIEADTASQFTLTFDSDFTNKDIVTGVTLATYTFPGNDNFVYTNTFIVDGTTIWWVIGDYLNSATATPFCKVRRNAAQGFGTGDVATAISWDTEDVDNASIFSSGSPTIITVPGSGNKIASIYLYVEWATNSTGIRRAWIYLNGAAVTGYLFQMATASSAVATTVHGCLQVPCVAGDTFEIRAYQNSGTTLNVTGILTAKFEPR